MRLWKLDTLKRPVTHRPTSRLGTPLLAAFAAVLALGSSGCVKRIVIDGFVRQTFLGTDAVDALNDYEQGRTATQANIVMFEGFHKLSPDNDEASFFLTKSWSFYSYLFAEDDAEAAEDAGNDALAAYHHRRAAMADDRAIYYGNLVLGHHASGFEAASRDEGSLRTWLQENVDDPDDAELVFWLGTAHVVRALASSAPTAAPSKVDRAADRTIGSTLLLHALKLDPRVGDGKASMMLALAKTGEKPLDNAGAKKLFDDARNATVPKGSNMLVAVAEASTLACAAGDGARYTQLLKPVVDPETKRDFAHGLENEAAWRRAKRWLSPKRAKARCNIDAH